MENQLIMLPNITLAVRARNILEAAGIHGYVEKSPKIDNKPSCGYSVFVSQNADKAVRLLQHYGFTILGVKGRYES